MESIEFKSEFFMKFRRDYVFVRELVDKRFGEICIFKYNQKYIARRSHVCNSSKDYIDFVK